MNWRRDLPDLLASGTYRTQAQIVRDLARRGASVDQSTVSRELRALGVTKCDGVYRLPEPPDLGAPIHTFAVTAGGCLAVLTTDPAYASVVATALDDLGEPGILGTIAGDDTVFVALRDPSALGTLRRLVGRRET